MVQTPFLTTVKFTLKNIFERPKIISDFNYDRYWNDKRKADSFLSSFQQSRADIVKGFLSPQSTVLDFGSGDGSVARYLIEKTGCRIFCSDFSKRALEFLEASGLETLSLDLKSDFSKVIADKDINTLTFFEVLEHIENPEKIIIEAQKSVQLVIFSVPNTGFISHRLRLLFGRFPMQWRLHPGEHLRFWTLSDMHWWCRELNLKSYKIIPYEGFPVLRKVCPALFSRGLIVVVGHAC